MLDLQLKIPFRTKMLQQIKSYEVPALSQSRTLAVRTHWKQSHGNTISQHDDDVVSRLQRYLAYYGNLWECAAIVTVHR